MKYYLIVLCLFLLSCGRNDFTIDNIEIGKHIDGCGCFLNYNNDENRYVFISSMEGEKGWMKIDGYEIELSLSKNSNPGIYSNGIKFYRYYSNEIYSVEINFEVTDDGSNSNESDGYSLSAKLLIKKGNVVKIINTKGVCSC